MSVEKRERRKWWCCQSVVRLFFLSFFTLRNFDFPVKIKKGGGEDPPDPLTTDSEASSILSIECAIN